VTAEVSSADLAVVKPFGRVGFARRLRDQLSSRENTLLLVLVAFVLIVSVFQPRFIVWSNLVLILSNGSVLGVVAVGEFLVVITGAIDISVAAILVLGAVICAYSMQMGIPPAAAVLLGVLAGGVAGLVNGALVVIGGLSSVVVTLATMALINGLLNRLFSGFALDGGQQQLGWLWQPVFLQIPACVLVFCFAALAVGAFVRWSELARKLFAVGSSEATARVAGVRVGRIRMFTFVVSGILAALAGVLVAAEQPALQLGNIGTNYQFLAIAAVVLGGTDIFGGSGRVRGVFVGVVLIYAIYNAMVIVAIPAAWQDAVVGGLIILAVCVDTMRNRHR
jgi:ribose transport system permease protein